MRQVTAIPQPFDTHPEKPQTVALRVSHHWQDATQVVGHTTWRDDDGTEWVEEWVKKRNEDMPPSKETLLSMKLTDMLHILETMANDANKTRLVILIAECADILDT